VTAISTTPPSVSPSFLHWSNELDHAPLGVGVGHADLGELGRFEYLRGAALADLRFDAADLGDVAHHTHAEAFEHLARESAGRDARGGLARGGALEHVADVAVVVLHRAHEIGVSRTRARDDDRVVAGRPDRPTSSCSSSSSPCFLRRA
jgi:hypothetical protein